MLWRTNDPQLQGVPFLVLMNKSDKQDKMTPEFIAETLLIEALEKVRPVKMQVCSALDGSGIWEGLNLMIDMIEAPQSTGDKASTSETNTVRE